MLKKQRVKFFSWLLNFTVNTIFHNKFTTPEKQNLAHTVNAGICLVNAGICLVNAKGFRMYDVRFTMYDVRCTMYDLRCKIYDVGCTM